MVAPEIKEGVRAFFLRESAFLKVETGLGSYSSQLGSVKGHSVGGTVRGGAMQG